MAGSVTLSVTLQKTEFGSRSVCVNDARVDQAATGRCLELLCVVRWWVRLAERLLESFRTWRWPLSTKPFPLALRVQIRLSSVHARDVKFVYIGLLKILKSKLPRHLRH
jgi:hypothetical protein